VPKVSSMKNSYTLDT